MTNTTTTAASNTKQGTAKQRAAPRVTIKEVGPRDGLQNEQQQVSTDFKVHMISKLVESGLQHIECGAFVSPRWVPQMADSDAVFRQLTAHDGVQYSALVPNEKGLARALAVGAQEVAVFAAASEAFSQKNINCTIAESFERFKPVIKMAQANNIPVRGYLSCVLGCPYQGSVAPQAVAQYSQQLIELGCYEVSLGDTIGIGSPADTIAMYEAVLKVLPPTQTALHFHDTYGRALANIWVCLERGARTIDSAIAGLGGCPYARGASGNVATENVVDLLHRSGYDTGISMTQLLTAAQFVYEHLQTKSKSAVFAATMSEA